MASVLYVAFAATRQVGGATRRQLSALLTPVEEFPGLPSTTPTPTSASSPTVTTMPNGLTVVSENSSSTSTISLTFPKAGSAFESATETGAALVSKYLAFKSGSGLSSALILRNLENIGATPFATAGRTNSTIGFTACPDKALDMVPMLATNCTFEKWDLIHAQKLACVEVKDAMSSAQTILTESLFAAAFGAQSAMGKPYYSTGANSASIKSFRDRAYVLNDAVLAATGISDHEAFVRAVEQGLSESSIGAFREVPTSTFIGAESRVHDPFAKYAHVALAFPVQNSSALFNVIKQCISLSMEGVSGFATNELVGVYGVTSPADAGAIVDDLCSFLNSAPSATVVERAKCLAKAETIFALDGGSRSLAEIMASSILESGTFSADNVVAAYDTITLSDVSAALEYMANTIPALAAVGGIDSVPYQRSIAARFT